VDPLRHATLSSRRRGGAPEDYLPLHSFFDTTKELCADNRHRLLHNAWGIRRIVLPIFGAELALSNGSRVMTKEVCEFDHVLADFAGKYMPTLGDFVGALASDRCDRARFEEIRRPYVGNDAVVNLLVSPYAVTGKMSSLLLTHNTWFLNEVLPQVFGKCGPLLAPGVAPAELFDRMRFELWMDNGAVPPPSAPRKIVNITQDKSLCS